MMKHVRIGLAILIVAVLVAAAVLLAPSYARNMEFQAYLNKLANTPAPDQQSEERLRIEIVSQATRMGLPVRPGDVRVQRAAGRLRLEVRYVVRVDLPIYTVDLHFRAQGGSR